jgi:hypothetical protein
MINNVRAMMELNPEAGLTFSRWRTSTILLLWATSDLNGAV